MTYVYVVRAEDDSGTGSGRSRGGSEEGNTVRRSGSPQGPLVAGTLADGAEGAAELTLGSLWSASAARAHTGSRAYFANGVPTSTCAALTTPPLVLGPAGSPSVLSFWSFRDGLESGYDGGVVEISTNGGSGWTKVATIPAYPATFATDSASCAATTQAPSRAGFTGNDAAWQGPYAVDLAPFADQLVELRFDFGTDPAVTSTGWYVDDVQVTNAARANACTTAPAAVPEVSSAASGVPLLLRRSGPDVVLSYEEIPGTGGYNVYEGDLGVWYLHGSSAGNVCGAVSVPAGGRRETVLTPSAGSRYYLVTTYTSAEGPSGSRQPDRSPGRTGSGHLASVYNTSYSRMEAPPDVLGGELLHQPGVGGQHRLPRVVGPLPSAVHRWGGSPADRIAVLVRRARRSRCRRGWRWAAAGAARVAVLRLDQALVGGRVGASGSRRAASSLRSTGTTSPPSSSSCSSTVFSGSPAWSMRNSWRW